jgi:hypothetical protein
VYYYIEDHLGTSRVIVAPGSTPPCYDADFYPFGGERIYTKQLPAELQIHRARISSLPKRNIDTKAMSHVKEESARASAAEYIRRQLGQGKSLSKSLLATVDFEKGEIIALSPTPLSPDETVQFDWGHTPQTEVKPEHVKIGDASYLAVPTPKADEQLVEAIYESLQNPQSICFLENDLAEAHDPWLQRAKSRVITNGSEVYHALLSVDRDKGKIEAAIREWDRPPTSIGALGVINEKASAHVASAKIITTRELTAFARTVQAIFIRAYDGEGYLVWKTLAMCSSAPQE